MRRYNAQSCLGKCFMFNAESIVEIKHKVNVSNDATYKNGVM